MSRAHGIPKMHGFLWRLRMRARAQSPSGRAWLQTMLESNRRALASLEKLCSLQPSLPTDSREARALKANIAEIERVLGEVAA